MQPAISLLEECWGEWKTVLCPAPEWWTYSRREEQQATLNTATFECVGEKVLLHVENLLFLPLCSNIWQQ